MDINQITTQSKIRVSTASVLWLNTLSFFDRIFEFLSLRQKRKFWGIVYDSVTKQPLDPVIVKLLYTDGKEVETCVTDISGRYGFLARPGKFKIFARKTNYVFPSNYVSGDRDGIYDHLYHGEFFVLYDDMEVVAPNIPMDPEGFDWNQTAKQSVVKIHPHWDFFVKRLFGLLFWFAFIFSMLYAWRVFPKGPLWAYWLPVVFMVLIILGKILPQPRLWGRVKINGRTDNSSGLLLELQSPQFSQVIFGKAITQAGGQFLLRANKGKFILNVSQFNKDREKVLLAVLPVKVGSMGTLNATIKIS